jgi:two-component system, sensor histidine kinase and response regulator
MPFPSEPKNSISVLIVEDVQSACEIICKTVSVLLPDALIFSANNGKTGLELFNKHNPDVVITDISMPEMNGLEMVVEIKSIKPETTFIVFTGHSEGDFLKEFQEVGINHYLLKPLDLAKLISTIDECRKVGRKGVAGLCN